MSKFKDNFSSESFYPDSNYYLDQENSPKEDPITEDQKSNIGGSFEWPNTYWFIAERTNGRLAMIGFMAVIINYTCLLYTSPSPRDRQKSRMPSSA